MLSVGAAAALFFRTPRTFDDAFITFRYARHLVQGHGLVFNIEDGPLEGFTNLLWVLLNAAAERVGLEQLSFSRALGVLSLGVSLSLAFAPKTWRSPHVLTAPILIASALWMPDLVQVAGSGLETSFAGLLTVLLGLLVQRPQPSRLAFFGISAALVMTRPDGALFVAAAVLAVAWPATGGLRQRAELSAALRRLLVFGGLAALALGGLTIFRVAYFGSVVPNTYFAKNADVASWQAGWSYWLGFARTAPQVPALLLLWLVGMVAQTRMTRLDLFALAGLAAYFVYVWKVGGDFMSYRFGYQVLPLVLVVVARSLVEVEGWAWWALAATMAAFCVFGASRPVAMEDEYGMQSVDLMNGFVEPGRQAGLALRQNLPPDTRISTTLAGAVPFYSGFFTIDEWGLNDRRIAMQPSFPLPKHARGHLKRPPPGYLAERKVDLELGHPVLCDCRQLCDDIPAPQVYVPAPNGQCLRAMYRSSRAEFRKYVCEHDFPRRHLDCEAVTPPVFSLSGSVVAVSPKEGVGGAREAVPLDSLLSHSHGVAFGSAPTKEALPGQQPIADADEPLLDSFHGGDDSLGWIDFPLPTDTRRVVLRVGGGDACEAVWAGLVVGEQVVARSCGQRQESMHSVLLEVPEGARGVRLVLMDAASGSWGHLLVSAVFIERDAAAQPTP